MKSFLAGLGIGVGLGMLFAPMSGEETRNNLKERANDLADQARDAMQQGKDRVRSGLQAVRGQTAIVAVQGGPAKARFPAGVTIRGGWGTPGTRWRESLRRPSQRAHSAAAPQAQAAGPAPQGQAALTMSRFAHVFHNRRFWRASPPGLSPSAVGIDCRAWPQQPHP